MITATKVRLVDQDIQEVVSIQEALNIARNRGLDLVEISPGANPPVCKILDFKKFQYEAKKKSKEIEKKHKSFDLKEIKIRPSIGINDLNIKIKNMKNFLSEGNHVRVNIIYRGREIIHKENGFKLFSKIMEELGDSAKFQAEPKFSKNNLEAKIIPNNIPKL